MRPESSPPKPVYPEAPSLAVGLRGVALVSTDGVFESLAIRQARARIDDQGPVILCHRPDVERRLNLDGVAALDLLELFAFVRPAQFCLPTTAGLARLCGLETPRTLAARAAIQHDIGVHLLTELSTRDKDANGAAIAFAMGRAGWAWAPYVLAALGAGREPPKPAHLQEGLKVWKHRSDWSEHAPEPPPGHLPVTTVEAREKLAQLLDPNAEDRPEQQAYCDAVSGAFSPTGEDGEPQVVLAEAGTGVGKTLAYIAPASVWSRKNEGPVWISTFTRNLQRQLDAELDRLYPDPVEKARCAVVRKGRENYFCWLNFDEALQRLSAQPTDAIGLGLSARWARATRDGDMVGGDFPSWLAGLIGHRNSLGLTDTRGECLYSACIHYRKCFVERSIRRARRAEIVIANHALVMVQSALGGGDEAYLPTRYVFDEGHHLFDAADAAFSALLSGQEAVELRRWLLGAETTRHARRRGLRERVEDLVATLSEAQEALRDLLGAARVLPSAGWLERLRNGLPSGPTEAFLACVYGQVYGRSGGEQTLYDLETGTDPLIDGLLEAAQALAPALSAIEAPAQRLTRALDRHLIDAAKTLDTPTRQRIEAVMRGLDRRCIGQIQGWRAMLGSLGESTPAEYVDWFSVERLRGKDHDVGLHRHWVDPLDPFVACIRGHAQGMLITSASLRDCTDDEVQDWNAADIRTGARHLATPAAHSLQASPFDYAAQARILVVTDMGRDNLDHLAGAYEALFLAAAGGGLGLFTAVTRLREVHRRIAPRLDEAGLPLYAQHVDAMDTGTLIDMFRAEESACLLGTDAVRDGVDVPGSSLRLIVFEKVPWPRADIVHRARKKAYGSGYDDMLTRLKLKQAFGRLIRKAEDKGVFVILDSRLPSRLCGAFPSTTEIRRVGLAEAIRTTEAFLKTPTEDSKGRR